MAENGKKRLSGPPGGQGGPRKKKGHYVQSATGRGTSEKAIPLGSTGLLVTCDSGREYKAYDEMMRLLEESFQRLGKDHVGRTAPSQPPPAAADAAASTDAAAAAAAGDTAEASDAQPAAAAAAGGSSKAPSIADMLKAEVADLKKERVHRFRRHNTDVRGTVFIEFPKTDDCPAPEAVALEIAKYIKETHSLPARYVMKLLPVSLTCFASPEDLKGLTGQLVDTYFGRDGDKAKEPVDFAVEYEHRASDKLKRPDVIDIVAKAVPQPPYKVSLSNPTRTILVQAVRNVAALSVVTSFKQLAKFNLRRLAEGEDEEGAEGAGAKPAAAAAASGDKAAAEGEAAAAAEGEAAAAAEEEDKGDAVEAAAGGEEKTAAGDA